MGNKKYKVGNRVWLKITSDWHGGGDIEYVGPAVIVAEQKLSDRLPYLIKTPINIPGRPNPILIEECEIEYVF